MNGSAPNFTDELWPDGLPQTAPGEAAADSADVDMSWTPVDMATVFSGNFSRPRATLGQRTDGIHLLYPGREHVISAEPESAKTWMMCKVVADVLAEGGTVVYVDFEDDEGTIGSRIHWLGTPVNVLCDLSRFRYLRPEVGATPDRYLPLLNFGTDDDPIGPTLVVLDGTTEGYGLHGWDINANEDSPKWRQTYVKPALRAGAATLGSDHVTKNKDTRNGYAIGAQHKKAGLTGVLFEMQVVDPFGIGLRGRARVLINKDRNGDLRQHGIRDGKATHFADLILDATAGEDECPRLWLFPPKSEDDEQEGDGVVVDPKSLLMNQIEHVLRMRGALGARDLRDAVPGRGSETDKAIQSLLNERRLHEVTKGASKVRHLPEQCSPLLGCPLATSRQELSDAA